MKQKAKTHTRGWVFLTPPSEETQDTHTRYKDSTEHLKTKFFIYFVTGSYTFPESSHSDTTVTQDKGIWHMQL